MDDETVLTAGLLKRLSRWLTSDEPSATDTSADETAAEDIYDERNNSTWFLLPPV